MGDSKAISCAQSASLKEQALNKHIWNNICPRFTTIKIPNETFHKSILLISSWAIFQSIYLVYDLFIFIGFHSENLKYAQTRNWIHVYEVDI